MRLWQGVIIASRALRANLLRSTLTMLGIIIGVAAVITMFAVGSGARSKVMERIQNLGANLILIVPGSHFSAGVHRGTGTSATLTAEDAKAIAEGIPMVEHAAPKVARRLQVVRGNRNWSAPVNGVTDTFFRALNWNTTIGGLFTEKDESQAAKVALLGRTVATKLFDRENPVGKEIRIKNVPLVVVGLLEQKGQSSGGQDLDDNVYIPLATAKSQVLGGKHKVFRTAVDAIVVRAAQTNAISEVAREIRGILRQRHRLRTDAPDDFRVVDITSIHTAHQAAARSLGVLLLAVASVSLIVGGISIMNIMLVSVTERTREIGLRLALGARRQDIRNQFLVEALLLCLLGGVMGVFCGVISSIAVANIGGWPIVVGPFVIVVAVGFSSFIGVFFGFYPATKAAALDPIEALRFE